jgi:hypothetical protein
VRFRYRWRVLGWIAVLMTAVWLFGGMYDAASGYANPGDTLIHAGDIAHYLRPDLSRAALGLAAPGEGSQPGAVLTAAGSLEPSNDQLAVRRLGANVPPARA